MMGMIIIIINNNKEASRVSDKPCKRRSYMSVPPLCTRDGAKYLVKYIIFIYIMLKE